jgi:hypothetical protein
MTDEEGRIRDTAKGMREGDAYLWLGAAMGGATPGELVSTQERAGGAEMFRNLDAKKWVMLPTDLGLGDYELRKALEDLGWPTTPSFFWRVRLSAYEDLGFVFHPNDVARHTTYLDANEGAEALWRLSSNIRYGMNKDTPAGKARREERSAHLQRCFNQHHDWVQATYGLEDPLFIRAQLPEGWTGADPGHPQGIWSYIKDDEGYDRIAIFYKAAFYDRHAHMSIVDVPETDAQKKWHADWYDVRLQEERAQPVPTKGEKIGWMSECRAVVPEYMMPDGIQHDRCVRYLFKQHKDYLETLKFHEVVLNRDGKVLEDVELGVDPSTVSGIRDRFDLTESKLRDIVGKIPESFNP